MVHNKQLMLTATKVHWSLPSCILPCSVQITEYDGISIIPTQMFIRVCKMENDPAATVKIQKVVVMIYVRFKVIICLYLVPNNKDARSLSTLMAVNVNKDTPHNA